MLHVRFAANLTGANRQPSTATLRPIMDRIRMHHIAMSLSRHIARNCARPGPVITALLAALVGLHSGGAAADTKKPAKVEAAAKAAPTDAGTVPASATETAPDLTLSAVIGTETTPISDGLSWRVFAVEQGNAPMREIKRSDSPEPVFDLPPGDYVIHAAYGFGSAAKRITLTRRSISERLSLPVGGLIVRGILNENMIAPKDLTIAVYIPSDINSEERLLSDQLQSGQMIRLPEGRYHIVSTYGASNASVRADIEVKTGKAVDVLMRHRAARITLKLVSKTGGEAIANTAWTVLTPGGDLVKEELGAFPTVILAEGNYTAIARHDGHTFVEEIKIVSGPDRDVEVLAINAK
jgi:hypothetical protein